MDVGDIDEVIIDLLQALPMAVMALIPKTYQMRDQGMSIRSQPDQLHRRRARLEREFRAALDDGDICEAEEKDIEALRKNLGLSHRAASYIREKVRVEMQSRSGRCQSCGQPLPVPNETKS
ncbi:hypothetical protein Q5Y75_21640 [Ruegeria sp. 2205SS24-7]|uniref:hypothetical protein n=1 Tax=Ruegeria discodermiae TaxID=3064389 RepID=UPI002740FA1A|nr:hypothetical protein [Ruegeria sp. 2205SS24-7]MDP5219829.1 hypothetical protein [Ruegeria sp. 2205SS24-7]